MVKVKKLEAGRYGELRVQTHTALEGKSNGGGALIGYADGFIMPPQ